MNIILRELKASIKSVVIWCGVFAVLVVMYMSEFSAFANNEQMLGILDSMPEAVLDAFQMNSFNLTTLTGFYGILFTYFMIVLAVHAVLKGNSIIAKEERDKTVEFTLVLPVKRNKIVLSKIITVIINCLIIDLFLYALILISAKPYLPEENFMKFILLVMTSTFIIQMIFMSIGVMLGCVLKQHRRSGYIGAATVIIFYLMSILSDLSEHFEFLKHITPFKFFNTVTIKNELIIGWIPIVISLSVIAICLVASFITYSKRDLYI